MPELAARGLARQDVDRETGRTFYRLNAEGHALLSAVMKRNGEVAAQWSRDFGCASSAPSSVDPSTTPTPPAR